MTDALDFPFFQRALAAALLASLACGVIGTYVVARGISTLSGGVAHAAFGGVGLGYLMGFPPMLGALGFAVLSGVAIGVLHRRLRSGLDTAISLVWSVGMAMGIFWIALAPGYAPDLTTYLFGSLLFVPWEYVAGVAALDAVIALTVFFFYKEFQAVCFDEEFAEVTGLPVEGIFIGLLVLTSLAIATLIRVVGILLAIALLTVPAAIARQWSGDLRAMMLASVGVAAFCTSTGLFLSYGLSQRWDMTLPTGPAIILTAAALYAASSLLRARSLRSDPAVPDE